MSSDGGIQAPAPYPASSCCRSCRGVLLYVSMKITLDKDSSEVLRTLDVLSVPAFIVDRQWNILACNDSVHAFFEYRRSEVIGRKLENFLTLDTILREREETDSAAMAIEALAGRSQSSLRAFCFRKNGSPLASQIAVVPNRDHRPDRIIVVVRTANRAPRTFQHATSAPARDPVPKDCVMPFHNWPHISANHMEFPPGPQPASTMVGPFRAGRRRLTTAVLRSRVAFG